MDGNFWRVSSATRDEFGSNRFHDGVSFIFNQSKLAGDDTITCIVKRDDSRVQMNYPDHF